MDSKNEISIGDYVMYKKGDLIIYKGNLSLDYGQVFEVKYVLFNCVVVGDPFLKVDFPINFKDCQLYSLLMMELL